jgi:DNA-binding CsgD family transcriptional regulator
MGESASLRARDYRAICQFVGECRDLGADPVAWRLHLLTQLCAQLGGRVGAGGEATGMAQERFIPLSTVDVGWENGSQRQAMIEWMQLQSQRRSPTGLLPWKEPVAQSMLMSRDDAFSDHQWYNSVQFCDYLARSDLDDLIVSLQRVSFGVDHYCGLTIMRSTGESKFSRRDKEFLGALHREIAPLVGRQLAAADEPSAALLSPRLRQILDCLLDGDGEKQAALRLGLTRQTVNQYVKAVYRHFRVNSRPQLMARWVRFDRSRALNRDKSMPGQ